jgi:molecular chaperone DnaK
MSRTTVDYGIDLGTTNSVISVANGERIDIIKNGNHEITPSLVYIDKRGRLFRGNAATAHMTRVASAADVQSEFKREMGQQTLRTFEAAGKSMNPEELSAEILSELRRAAEERSGTAPGAAVITVPAMFELPQNDATARAAKLAGFEHSLLLQEPVAAATAYGFQGHTDKAYWLVYDYGGGTFDASIVSIRDGQLSVVRHAGDNYMGGADFDRVIVDDVLIPRLQADFDLSTLDRAQQDTHPVIRGRLAVLKKHAEQIKMTLTRDDSDTGYIDEVFPDDSGQLVDIEYELTRSDFEQLIAKYVQKSIDITSRLISDAALQPADIEKVLLVGGSTFVPLVQQQVATLGIPVDRSLDPMTVVSYGAAVFASAQRLPRGTASTVPVAAGTARVELEYEPVGTDLNPLVGGKLLINEQAPKANTIITITRDDNGFSSGDLPLDNKGRFFTNVRIRETGQSQFTLKARDPAGTPLVCSIDTFAITYGLSVQKGTLSQAFSVGLADGSSRVLLPMGSSLPATSEVFNTVTVYPIRKGTTDLLSIPFQSGDNKDSDLNLTGTCWKLQGTELSRDLPQNSEVEIVVEVDASGTTSATVTIPFLDEQFTVSQDTELQHEPADIMRSRLQKIEEQLEELEDKADTSGETQAGQAVAQFRNSEVFDEIDQKVELWESNDGVAAGQARNLIVEATRKVKELAGRVDWPARVAEYEEITVGTRRAVHEYGDAEDQQLFEKLIEEGSRALEAREPQMLENAGSQLRLLGTAMLQKDPAYLSAVLAYFAEDEERFTDRARARVLLGEGSLAARREDTEALQSIIHELWQLLPREVSVSATAAIASSIIER